jgi:3-oxoacyl-[acyl-carrier protein] reductase
VNTLAGKRALVCGSTRGIGRACALHFAQLGAEITLVARDEARLKDVQRQLSDEYGRECARLCADFADPDGLGDQVQAHVSQVGPIHILLNNTGGPAAGPVRDARPEEFLSAFKQHLICNHLLVRTLADGMRQVGYGRIINIISTSVKEPIADLGVSNTVRAAVASWAKTLAGELGPYGITVNNILPGATRTERLTDLLRYKARKAGTSLEELERSFKEQIPARRFADPEEIAAAAGFLASPMAGYINGINLPVDGGRTCSL